MVVQAADEAADYVGCRRGDRLVGSIISSLVGNVIGSLGGSVLGSLVGSLGQVSSLKVVFGQKRSAIAPLDFLTGPFRNIFQPATLVPKKCRGRFPNILGPVGFWVDIDTKVGFGNMKYSRFGVAMAPFGLGSAPDESRWG